MRGQGDQRPVTDQLHIIRPLVRGQFGLPVCHRHGRIDIQRDHLPAGQAECHIGADTVQPHKHRAGLAGGDGVLPACQRFNLLPRPRPPHFPKADGQVCRHATGQGGQDQGQQIARLHGPTQRLLIFALIGIQPLRLGCGKGQGGQGIFASLVVPCCGLCEGTGQHQSQGQKFHITLSTMVVAARNPNTCRSRPVDLVFMARNPRRSYKARARLLLSITSSRTSA